MSRNITPIIYGVLAVLAIGLGLFVANLFGNPTSSAPSPNGVASVSARTAAPAASARATSAPTQASRATSAPTTAPKTTNEPTAAASTSRTSAPATTSAGTTVSAPTSAAPTAPTDRAAAPPAAATATEQATAAPAYIEYTVQRGDSLKVIAQRYNVTLQQILAINDIPNPDVLTIGSTIKIPTSPTS